jgi:thiosulfate dehydrogenase
VKFVLGLIVGLLILPIFGYLYINYGFLPVSVADLPFPYERGITRIPLKARIKREAPQTAPIQANDDTLLEGAKIYRAQCMVCHGQPSKQARFAEAMFPKPPQLWEKSGDHTGVSDDPPGYTYWQVRNGIRLTGMPSFTHMLDDTQMWQVSLLLANADKPMPAPVQEELAKHARE